MSALPPVATAGFAGDVGNAVAAAFGARGLPRSPPVAPSLPRRDGTEPAPRRVQEDDGGWDPVELAPAPTTTPRVLTLGQLWEGMDNPRPTARGASLAAAAVSYKPAT